MIKNKRRVYRVFEFEKPRIEIAEISEDGKYGRLSLNAEGYGTTLLIA